MSAGFVSCFSSSIGEPAFVGEVLRFNLLVKLGVCVCVLEEVLRGFACKLWVLSSLFFLSFLPSSFSHVNKMRNGFRGILLVYTQCCVGRSHSLEPTLIHIVSIDVGHVSVSIRCTKIYSLKLVWSY